MGDLFKNGYSKEQQKILIKVLNKFDIESFNFFIEQEKKDNLLALLRKIKFQISDKCTSKTDAETINIDPEL
jgi:hypothetical protein